MIRLFSRFIYLLISQNIGQGLFRFFPEAETDDERKEYSVTANLVPSSIMDNLDSNLHRI